MSTNKLWYEDIKVLLNNPLQIFPLNSYNKNDKINAIARLAIYLAFYILIMKIDNKYLSISIILLILSFLLGGTENFISTDPNLNQKCRKPTINNPFMNYTIGDLIDHKESVKACDYDNTKKLMRQTFRTHLHSDSTDIWGKYITDRNFYTMPNTNIVNDQINFANWCYGGSGSCKSYGKNCLKNRDPLYHRGRLTNLD